jgi:peptide/nickel transport system substrate-binding protein
MDGIRAEIGREEKEMDDARDPLFDALTRREVLRRLGVLGAGIALSGTAARAAGAATSSLKATPSAFRFALAAQPRSLDVATNYEVNAIQVMKLVNEPLVVLTPNFQVAPWLATWSHPTPTKHVYKLRRGLRFSDGSALTAADVVWSLQRHTQKALASQIGSYFGGVKSITATGPNEVTVHLSAPDPGFVFFAMDALILKKSFAEPLGKNYGRVGSHMIGTGPFTLTSFSSTDISLARNPTYWGPKPPVDTMRVPYIPNPQAQQLAMRSGSIDAVFSVQPTDAANYQKISNVKVLTSAGGLTYFLAFNLEAEPWNDLHVRRAVAHCWDGPDFVKGALRGLGQVSTGMAFPWQWQSLMSRSQTNSFLKSLPSYPFSISKAKAELSKSKSSKGFSATIAYPSAYPNYGLALQSLAANLQQIGVTLKVNEQTEAAWLNALYGHKGLGMSAIIFGPDYADPHDFIVQTYASSGAVPNAFNLANLKNPSIDRLLKLEAASTSKAKRAQYLKQIYRFSATQLPYLGLWYDDSVMAIRKPFTYQGFNPMFYLDAWVKQLKA